MFCAGNGIPLRTGSMPVYTGQGATLPGANEDTNVDGTGVPVDGDETLAAALEKQGDPDAVVSVAATAYGAAVPITPPRPAPALPVVARPHPPAAAKRSGRLAPTGSSSAGVAVGMSTGMRMTQTIALRQIQTMSMQMHPVEKEWAELYAAAEKRTYRKHGLEFEYALVTREQFPYMMAIGSPGLHCNGMRFVMKDFFVGTPEQQRDFDRYIELIAVHEYGESLFRNHHQASMLEFAVAMEEGILPKFMEFLEKGFFLKFRDVSLFRMGKALRGALAKRGVKMAPPETSAGEAVPATGPSHAAALRLKDGFKWPAELREKYANALDEDKEAAREAIKKWAGYITVNEQTRAFLKKASDAAVRTARSAGQLGLPAQEVVTQTAASFYSVLRQLGNEFRENVLEERLILLEVAGTALAQAMTDIRDELGKHVFRQYLWLFGQNINAQLATLVSVYNYMKASGIEYPEKPEEDDTSDKREHALNVEKYRTRARLYDDIRVAMLRRVVTAAASNPMHNAAKAIRDEVLTSAGEVGQTYAALWKGDLSPHSWEKDRDRATPGNFRYIRESFRLALIAEVCGGKLFDSAGFLNKYPFEAQAIVDFAQPEFEIRFRTTDPALRDLPASSPTPVNLAELQQSYGPGFERLEDDWFTMYNRYLAGELKTATTEEGRQIIINEMVTALSSPRESGVQSNVDKGIYDRETAVRVLTRAWQINFSPARFNSEKTHPLRRYFFERYGRKALTTDNIPDYVFITSEFATSTADYNIVWETLERAGAELRTSPRVIRLARAIRARGYGAVRTGLEEKLKAAGIDPADVSWSARLDSRDGEHLLLVVEHWKMKLPLLRHITADLGVGLHTATEVYGTVLDRYASPGRRQFDGYLRAPSEEKIKVLSAIASEEHGDERVRDLANSYLSEMQDVAISMTVQNLRITIYDLLNSDVQRLSNIYNSVGAMNVAGMIAGAITEAKASGNTKRLARLSAATRQVLLTMSGRPNLFEKHRPIFEAMVICFVSSHERRRPLLWESLNYWIDIKEFQDLHRPWIIGRHTNLDLPPEHPVAVLFKSIYDEIEASQNQILTENRALFSRNDPISDSHRLLTATLHRSEERNLADWAKYHPGALGPLVEGSPSFVWTASDALYKLVGLEYENVAPDVIDAFRHTDVSLDLMESKNCRLERTLRDIQRAIDGMDSGLRPMYRVFLISVLGYYMARMNVGRTADTHYNYQFGIPILSALIVDELADEIASGRQIRSWDEALAVAHEKVPISRLLIQNGGELMSFITTYSMKVLSRTRNNDPQVALIKEHIQTQGRK